MKLYNYLCEPITPNRKADQKESENFGKQRKEQLEIKAVKEEPELDEENMMVKVNLMMVEKIQEAVKHFEFKNGHQKAYSFPRSESVTVEKLVEKEERVKAYYDLAEMQSNTYEEQRRGKENLNPIKVKENVSPKPKIMAFVNVIEVFKEYDGRTGTNFDAWLERLTDLLEAHYPVLNDKQKIARLKASMVGQAREKLSKLQIGADETYENLVPRLKQHFQCNEERSLALVRLSMMERKLENEELSSFIDRFEKVVKQATSGLTDAEVKRKLFEEFMLKLDPELAFHVRMAEPADYSRALEAARKTEVLLKLKNMDNAKATIATVQVKPDIDYEELASRIADMLQNDNQQSPEPPAMSHEEEQADGINIERLADLVAERLGLMEEEEEFYDEEEEEQNEPEEYYHDSPDQYPYGPKLCYYCNQPGHIQRNCYVKMRDEGNLYPDQINAVEVSRLELENELEMLKAENCRLGENIRKGRLQKPQ